MKRPRRSGDAAGDRAEPAAEGARLLPGIADKEYFRIGEVAQLVGVRPYVLRFWEVEFKRNLRPERSRSNQRMYRRKDVETFLEIKRLRYEEKLEVGGARERLRRGAAGAGAPAATMQEAFDAALAGRPPGDAALLDRLRAHVEELVRVVDEDEKDA